MRAQDRLRAIRKRLSAIMGERGYRIRKNGDVQIYNSGWTLVGHWARLEEILLALPDGENGKKWLTGESRVIYY